VDCRSPPSVQRDAREKYVVAQVDELIIRLRPVGFDCVQRPAACDDDGTIRARVEVAVQHNSATRLTYDDYMRFPDDGLRHEIIEGEHYVTPSPATRHQRILLTLSHLLQTYLDGHPVGEIFFAPFDVLLSEFNVFVPDLIYLSRERAHLLTAKNLQGAPDLAVEILSPGTRSRDERLKRDVYQRTGVREYWILDPDQNAIDVYRWEGPESSETPRRFAIGEALTTPLVPGLALPLDKLFGSER
jgi:Uma2 family endonuclease